MAERAGARRAGLVADVHDSVEVEEEASNPSASLTTAEAYPPGCGRAHQAEHWPEQPPALPAARRYEYFIKRSASHGELWGLHGDGGWVMAEDDDAIHTSLSGPHPRFAKACSTGPWEGEDPQAIDVDEWVEGWIPQLQREGFRIAVLSDDPGSRNRGLPGKTQTRSRGGALALRALNLASVLWVMPLVPAVPEPSYPPIVIHVDDTRSTPSGSHPRCP